MNINNCYEAYEEMNNLSERLSVLYAKNAKTKHQVNERGQLDGGIDATESEFLLVKHSLAVINIPNYKKSAYEVMWDMINYKNELDALMEEKQDETNQSTRVLLGRKIKVVEGKYLELKKVLSETTYVKNLKYI